MPAARVRPRRRRPSSCPRAVCIPRRAELQLRLEAALKCATPRDCKLKSRPTSRRLSVLALGWCATQLQTARSRLTLAKQNLCLHGSGDYSSATGPRHVRTSHGATIGDSTQRRSFNRSWFSDRMRPPFPLFLPVASRRLGASPMQFTLLSCSEPDDVMTIQPPVAVSLSSRRIVPRRRGSGHIDVIDCCIGRGARGRSHQRTLDSGEQRRQQGPHLERFSAGDRHPDGDGDGIRPRGLLRLDIDFRTFRA